MSLPPIDLAVFHSNGYKRKQCRVTGLWFWTNDAQRETCGDTTEDEYTFIGDPLITGFQQRGKALKDAMREAFLSFFEQREHTRIAPYPVLARWRDDIHLTIASIADFQPHVTSGSVDPPANPLAISQPCIRLTDVDAVGRSGRHLTTFEMMAHHVFNRPDEGEEIYWMETCVEHCHRLLTETFGVPQDHITYVENPWCGGGNAGAAVEVIVGGLELATLVFMDMEEHKDGDIVLKGDRYRKMPLQIIDTGYGLERFCWAAAGTPTIYEAIYPESVAWLKELSGFDAVAARWPNLNLERLLGEMSRLNGIMNIEAGVDGEKLVSIFLARLKQRGIVISAEQFVAITEPLSNIYAIPDHLHALCNMLGDGLVPSNAKAGYLARMLARRVLRMRDELRIQVSLPQLAEHHLDVHLGGHLNKQHRDGLLTILRLEEDRYVEMLRKGSQVVQTQLKHLLKDAEVIPDTDLFTLNDSHGLAPDMAVALARQSGWPHVTLRAGFSAEMAERHARLAKEAALSTGGTPFDLDVTDYQSTEPLYYANAFESQCISQVVGCIKLNDSPVKGSTHVVILERSIFYPEGGGQEGDRGTLQQGDKKVNVLDTQKTGSVILHFTDGPVTKNQDLVCQLDWKRRKQLMDHHTAVHIVGGAARRLLGPHIFQAGSHLSTENGRLDITHYHRLTRQELDAMEDMANAVLASVSMTEKSELNRKDADLIHGFDLYQGGAPKGNSIRILKIAEHDTQACGGTHHDEPGQIGSIRIVRATAVQDGVERLHIVAGEAALTYAREQDELLRVSAEVFGVQPEDLPRAATRFFREWKEQKKTIEHLESEIVRLRTTGSTDAGNTVDGVRIFVLEIDGDLKTMTTMLKELTLDVNNPTVAILGSRDGGGKLMIGVTESTIAAQRYNAVDLLRSISHHIQGGGGGRPTFAQGGGSRPEGIPEALSEAKERLGLMRD